mgnify:CR=1 FL=1
MMATTHRLALGLAAVLLVLGCRRGGESKATGSEVERTWKKHEAVVEGALQRHKYNEDELLAAISFFEKTTGINSPRGWDEVGQVIVPTPELNKDFERWRVWYVEHQQSLYLDAATGELRLRSNQGR